MIELQFDTNVVPDANYFHDYEQLWKEQKNKVIKNTYDEGSYDVKDYYTGGENDSIPLAGDNEAEE